MSRCRKVICRNHRPVEMEVQGGREYQTTIPRALESAFLGWLSLVTLLNTTHAIELRDNHEWGFWRDTGSFSRVSGALLASPIFKHLKQAFTFTTDLFCARRFLGWRYLRTGGTQRHLSTWRGTRAPWRPPNSVRDHWIP